MITNMMEVQEVMTMIQILGCTNAMGRGRIRCPLFASEIVVIDFFDGNIDRPFVEFMKGNGHPPNLILKVSYQKVKWYSL